MTLSPGEKCSLSCPSELTHKTDGVLHSKHFKTISIVIYACVEYKNIANDLIATNK